MKTFKSIEKTREHIQTLKRRGKTIGFVPTMGYLHEGHLSLMRQCRKECDVSVISIFVNPTQFGPKEDLSKYPRDFKRDGKLAKTAGVDIIFYPTVKTMYPKDRGTSVDAGALGTVMCGKSRPGHFKGVTTVVAKLFNIIQPDIAYFGQKDAQQAVIIGKMVRDLNMPVKIEVLPIIREHDGLAMSSRNTYLTDNEREDAPALYRSLKMAERLARSGEKSSAKIKLAMRKMICEKKRIVIDYISVADADNLKERKYISNGTLIAVAAWVGKTRIIDNIII